MMVKEWKKSNDNEKGNFLFWQTKSNVQPLGEKDEWGRFLKMPDKIKIWADQGKAESELRPGIIDTKRGNKADCQMSMTKVT